MPLDDNILLRLRKNDPTLRELDLMFQPISERNAEVIGEILQGNTNLSILYFTANGIEDIGAAVLFEAIAKNTSLTYLEFSENCIGERGAKALARAIANNTALSTLHLADNFIDSDRVKELSEALAGNRNLMELNLFNNRIGDEGAKAIARGLEQNVGLSTLELGMNQISDVGAAALAEAIERSIALTELKLDSNQITEAGTAAIMEALKKNANFRAINLENNQISNPFINQINSLTARNQKYFRSLQAEACKQLKVIRIMLYKVKSADTKDSHYLDLPLELKEEIAKHVVGQLYMTEEQQRLIINYAEGKIAPVADKLSFFKVTKCDKVMKKVNITKEKKNRCNVC